MDLLERIDAAGAGEPPVRAAATGAAAKLGEMLAIVDRFHAAGVAPNELSELRCLLTAALRTADAGADWRASGGRVIALCEAVVASTPLEGAALWDAAMRILGGEIRR